ncbi:MAG: ferritin-like domain-containing protein [Gemmataceae bacterium]|nr:ferritin-like domain-containing protein [Gemmataceae bacterium]MDW8266607.1 ferritin-like domain-containing protein [Gemmataceae bacterium]
MDTAKVIDKLNAIVRWEWTGIVQYTQHSFLVQDLWREVYASFFRKSAEESMKHCRLIGDKIVALGGVPTVERAEIRQSTDLREMLRFNLEFERKAVQLYTEALELAQDNHPLRILLEDLLLEEQSGVEELEKLMATQERAAQPRQEPASKVG